MRWKSKAEAQAELQRLVAEHEGLGYAYWRHVVGYQKRLESTTLDGSWYQATVEPVWDDEPGGTIRILFSLDDGGPSALFPMTDSLLVERTPMTHEGAIRQPDGADGASRRRPS